MKPASKLYVLLFVLNFIGILISLALAKINDVGGGALGYLLFGLGITGAISLLTALIGVIRHGREMFNSGSKTAAAIILLLLCFWEISFIFYLKIWR